MDLAAIHLFLLTRDDSLLTLPEQKSIIKNMLYNYFSELSHVIILLNEVPNIGSGGA